MGQSNVVKRTSWMKKGNTSIVSLFICDDLKNLSCRFFDLYHRLSGWLIFSEFVMHIATDNPRTLAKFG